MSCKFALGKSRAAGEADEEIVGGRGRRLSEKTSTGRHTSRLCVSRQKRQRFSSLKIWVHRAVGMDATALFKNGARGRTQIGSVLQMYADGGVYMMRAFGR